MRELTHLTFIPTRQARRGTFLGIASLLTVSLVYLSLYGSTYAQESSLLERLKTRSSKDFSMSAAGLRIHLQDMARRFDRVIETTADAIIMQADDETIKTNALVWKMNTIPAAYQALFYRKPLIALVDAWALAVQIENFFASDEAVKAFGRWHVKAYDAAVLLEQQLTEIAKKLSGDGNISGPREFVHSWAVDHPIKAPLFMRDTIIVEASSGMGEKALGVFAAAGQLSNQMEDMLVQLTVLGDYLPRQSRWQAELLLSDLKVMDELHTASAQLAKATKALEEANAFIQDTPQLIGDERDIVLKSLTKERMAIMQEIDRQRLHTLAVLEKERAILQETVEEQRTAVMATLEVERKTILNEIESIRQRMVKEATAEIEGLIDHFFYRTAQLVGLMALLVMVLALFIYRRLNRSGNI